MVQKSMRRILSRALALLTSLLVVGPCAFAKSKPAEPLAAVVGRVSLSGPPVVQMFMQEHGRQQYLLIQQASMKGFTVIDVTRPSEASIVKQVASPTHASSGKLQLMKTGLVVSSSEDNSETTPESSPTQTVNLLDARDPAHPQVIQTFTGVTDTLVDETRGLMYITNAEGLWIVKYKQEQPEVNDFGCPTDGSTTTDPICSN